MDARLHEVLQPRVVHRGVNPLPPAQLCHGDLPANISQENREFLFGGKAPPARLLRPADQRAGDLTRSTLSTAWLVDSLTLPGRGLHRARRGSSAQHSHFR